MSRPADRLCRENANCKRDVAAQLRDILRRLESPSIALRDWSGHVTHGLVPIPHEDEDQFRREGYNGETEFTFTIRLYDASKNALTHLPQATDLTGD